MSDLVFEGSLHRTRRRHSVAFSAEAPVARLPVRRPSRVAVMLAEAHRIAEAIEDGRLHDRADAARVLGWSRARVTQVLDLLLLAPDLQELILFSESLDGQEPLSEHGLRRVVSQAEWGRQRAAFPSAMRAVQ